MAKTIEDDFNFGDAQEFQLPSDGYHLANLSAVAELAPTKKSQSGETYYQEQWVLTFTLSDEDTDAPNLPLSLYLGCPCPEDKDVKWGGRTAWGAKIQAIKELMTALGGPESGGINKDKISAFLNNSVGKAVKVRTKQKTTEAGTNVNIQGAANQPAVIPA